MQWRNCRRLSTQTMLPALVGRIYIKLDICSSISKLSSSPTATIPLDSNTDSKTRLRQAHGGEQAPCAACQATSPGPTARAEVMPVESGAEASSLAVALRWSGCQRACSLPYGSRGANAPRLAGRRKPSSCNDLVRRKS
jgi:hypothetical protein